MSAAILPRPFPSSNRFTVHLPCRWRVVGTEEAPLGPVVAQGKIGMVFSPLYETHTGHPIHLADRPNAVWWTIKELLFNEGHVEGVDGRWNLPLGTEMDLMIDFPATSPITRSVFYSRYTTHQSSGVATRRVDVVPHHSTWGDACEVLDLFGAIFAWQYPGSEIDYTQARGDWESDVNKSGPVASRFLVDYTGAAEFRQKVLAT